MIDSADIQLRIHGVPTGPDYYRLMTILALKEVSWQHSSNLPAVVRQSLKSDCTLPVMQYGNNYFEGSMIATLALEQIQPAHSLFPNGNKGMPLALGWWSDAFYRDVSSSENPVLLHRHCTLISRQLDNGREYLQGGEPGLADVHSYSPLKALQVEGYDLSEVMDAMPLLSNWYQRVDALRDIAPVARLLEKLSADYPECDSIAEKVILADGNGCLWRTSLV
jgi:hypothetical protein